MSFLYDPVLLVGTGAAAGASLEDEKENAATVGVTVFFWSVSIPLWFNARRVEWFAKMWGGKSGRDFMLNSGRVGLGLLSFDPEKTGLRRHLVAGLIFLTYPLWFRLGWSVGRRFRPARGRDAALSGADEEGRGASDVQHDVASGPDTVTSTAVK